MDIEIKDINNIGEAEAVIAEEEERIHAAYHEIGKLYYSLHSADCEPQFKPYIDALTDAAARIEEANARILSLKGIKTCPRCGAAVKEESIFCTSCGTRLKTVPEPAFPEKETVTCDRCGSEMRRDMRFCTVCGNPLVEKAPPTPDYQPTKVYDTEPMEEPVIEAVKEPEPEIEPVAMPEPEPEKNPYAAPAPSTICPMCGRVSAPGAKFCVGCGTRIADQPAPAPEQEAPVRRCQNCGHISANPSLPFCTECGSRLN